MSIEATFISTVMPMAQYGGGQQGWGDHMVNMPFGGGFMMLMLVAVVFLVVLLSRGISRKEESPLDVLKRRYANGDIDKETYERMRKDIEG